MVESEVWKGISPAGLRGSGFTPAGQPSIMPA
jgi:hypothetical protein